MVSRVDQEIIRIYDEKLSKFPHISSLKINKDNFKLCLNGIFLNKRYKEFAERFIELRYLVEKEMKWKKNVY